MAQNRNGSFYIRPRCPVFDKILLVKNGDDGYFKYAQIGLELAGAVLLGFFCGYKLDAYLGTSPWLMLTGSAAGLGGGFYLVIRELPKEK